MRRILLGLTLGALIFGVAFAGAKVKNGPADTDWTRLSP